MASVIKMATGPTVFIGRSIAKPAILKMRQPQALVLSRTIAGKAMRVIDPNKPPPMNYHKYTINFLISIFDKTTLRFDENSKIIVVQGAHAVGKSKLAEELAEEFGMKHVPQPTMDYFYKSPYGHLDMRDYEEYYLPKNKPYDEKDFIKDPFKLHGCVDRFSYYMFVNKYRQYFLALRHLFNTGQGVVLESNPFSHYIDIDACFNSGYIDKSSMNFLDAAQERTLHKLLRPNLIIYLDAPIDIVRKKIQDRGNAWDKNSPVWANTPYLNDLYNGMKRDYLQKAKKNSQVLVYDWSEPGETDIVVEDIEELNFDHYGVYDSQQCDWRLYNDEYMNKFRYRYSNVWEQRSTHNLFASIEEYDAEELHLSAEELMNLRAVGSMFPGHDYEMGYNTSMGDSAFDIYFNPFYYALVKLHKDWWYPFDVTEPRRTSYNKWDYGP